MESFTTTYNQPLVQSSGHVAYLQPSDLSQQQVSACFSQPGTVTFTATLAENQDKNGTISTLSFPFSSNVPPNILAPIVTNTFLTDGGVLLTTTSTAPYVTTLSVANADGTSPTFGEKWQNFVAMPAAGAGGAWAGGNGTWNFIQMITLNATRINNGIAQTLYASNGATTPQYYLTGLDTCFPYEPITGPNLFWPADGVTRGQANDPPGSNIDPGTTSEAFAETFTDYIMFTPPGQGSQPVPLQSFTWAWSATPLYNALTFQWQLLAPNYSISSKAWASPPPAWPDWSNLVRTFFLDSNNNSQNLLIRRTNP